MIKKNKSESKIIGNITLFKLAGYITEKSEFAHRKVLDWLRVAEKSSNEMAELIYSRLKKAKILKEYQTHHNIIVTAGRTVLARLLSGDTTYSGEVNYGALGTDDTAADNGDTTLGTETFRKLQSSQSYSANVCYVDFFYSATDCDGTYEEFGNFIDGAAGADTGQLFSHLITGSWVKSNTESLFVSCKYTIS